jgi:FdhD protein
MQNLRRFAGPRPSEGVAVIVRPRACERLPLPGGPQLSREAGQLLRQIRVSDEYGDEHAIQVPVERPLSVLVEGRHVATLWTLGACPEWLVLGYLWNQQLVTDVTHLESITVNWQAATAEVRSRDRADPAKARDRADSAKDRDRTDSPRPGGAEQLLGISAHLSTDASGSIVEKGALPILPGTRISRSTLLAVIERVPQDDAVYRAAGSVHGCALFHGTDLWLSIEDVSRRNAIDAVLGWMALHGERGADKILVTTGRLSAEIVAKAAYSGVPILISRKGVTATAVDLGAKLGMTLFGHAVQGRYLCYAGGERFEADS